MKWEHTPPPPPPPPPPLLPSGLWLQALAGVIRLCFWALYPSYSEIKKLMFKTLNKQTLEYLQGPFKPFNTQYNLIGKANKLVLLISVFFCHKISIATWRLILRPLWWVMVIYSICILLLIYTYQFDNMPVYWHNATGLSDQW